MTHIVIVPSYYIIKDNSVKENSKECDFYQLSFTEFVALAYTLSASKPMKPRSTISRLRHIIINSFLQRIWISRFVFGYKLFRIFLVIFLYVCITIRGGNVFATFTFSNQNKISQTLRQNVIHISQKNQGKTLNGFQMTAVYVRLQKFACFFENNCVIRLFSYISVIMQRKG